MPIYHTNDQTAIQKIRKTWMVYEEAFDFSI